jgi:hypothetical protein
VRRYFIGAALFLFVVANSHRDCGPATERDPQESRVQTSSTATETDVAGRQQPDFNLLQKCRARLFDRA